MWSQEILENLVALQQVRLLGMSPSLEFSHPTIGPEHGFPVVQGSPGILWLSLGASVFPVSYVIHLQMSLLWLCISHGLLFLLPEFVLPPV